MSAARQGSHKARVALTFLRQKISSGEWPINSRIPRESELMEMMDVGKSTVREAVRSLASMGMLETIRGVGTFVRSTSPISTILTDYITEYGLDEVLTYRRALEIEAAQLAAVNRTEQQLAMLRAAFDNDYFSDPDMPRTVSRGTTPGPFHYYIFEAAGSPLLTAMYSGVMAVVRRAINEGRIAFGSGHDLRHRDHAALLDAIERQDLTQAAHAMALHVDRDLVPRDDESAATVRIEALLAAGNKVRETAPTYRVEERAGGLRLDRE